VTAPLHLWPKSAEVGRIVPKQKFCEHAKIATATKQKFIDDVQQIVWAFKLAEETVGLRGTEEVPEIQIFSIQAKDDDISNLVLATIDRAIPLPIVFELRRQSHGDEQLRVTAAHKTATSTKPKPAAYFTSGWLPAGSDRKQLPPAIDLLRLYGQLLSPLLPTPVKPEEGLTQAIVRSDEIRRLEREISRLETMMKSEPQFNRKVELRRKLKILASQLTTLAERNPSNPEKAPWRT
jgi:hypothetical protein